ncbi:MAG: 3-hydroxybutyryl-CoA dehydrogenase, partial [uncultured Gemmatimonadaceae bacterium]
DRPDRGRGCRTDGERDRARVRAERLPRDDDRRLRRRARAGPRDDREEPRAPAQEGRPRRGRPRRHARPPHDGAGARRRRRRRARDRGRDRERGAQAPHLRGARPRGRAGRDPGDEHQLDLDHRDRGADAPRRAGDRDALHEPGAGDAARRGDPGARHLRRHHPPHARAEPRRGQDARRGERLPGLRREPHPHADDQRGRLLRHGGGGDPGRDRHRDEARHEPPHGAARARRLHRPRHLRRDPRGDAPRARRPEVPPLPAPPEVRRRRVAGAEVGARVLQLLV